MDRCLRLLITGFLALLVTVIAVSTPAQAGEIRLRFGPTFVSPSDAHSGGPIDMEFLDPANPLLGHFGGFEDHRIRVNGALGLGVDVEFLFGQLIGLDVNLGYSEHDLGISFGGEIIYTPAAGEPPVLLPGSRETAAIVGSGSGDVRSSLLTVGVNFHVLRKENVDLYFGPFVGVNRLGFELEGRFTASFEEFTSITPLASGGRSNNLAYGGGVGVDVPLGGPHWMLSAAARYTESENVDPWSILVGAGYRFR